MEAPSNTCKLGQHDAALSDALPLPAAFLVGLAALHL